MIRALVGSWKIYAVAIVILTLLSSVVWAQYNRIDSLKEQRATLQSDLEIALKQNEKLINDKQLLDDLLVKREKERTLLYVEINSLKTKITQLDDKESVDWLATPIPDTIVRLLPKSSVYRANSSAIVDDNDTNATERINHQQ